MSTRELFGESSSDEEEPQKQEQPKAAATTAPQDGAAAGPSASQPKPARTLADNDDDDDDDDVEFDDKGAVVGLSSTTIAGDKASASGTAKRVASSDGQADQRNDGAPKSDTRTLRIQHVPRPKHDLHMTKLPNLLGIQTTAFHPDTYNPAAEEEVFGQSAYNLIRWRYKNAARDGDGQLQRESNTRLVQWEDQTWTLHIGKEVFEVDINDSSSNNFCGLNGYLYLSQKADLVNDNDNNNKTVNGTSTVLECMGGVNSRLTVRPASLQSDAHKSLTVGIRQKTVKKARIAEYVTQEDPEKLKQERIRVKADLEKAAARKKQQQAYGTSGSGYRSYARPRMTRAYLEQQEEDDRDFDTTRIKDLKRRAADYDEMDDYGEDSDDDDDEELDDNALDQDEQHHHTFTRVRPKKKKRLPTVAEQVNQESDDDEDDEDIVMDDEDDEEDVARIKASKKRTLQAVLDDDDDSD